MRRIMSLTLCFVLAFCLSACDKEKTFTLVPFSRDVTFDMADMTVRGTLTFEAKDNIAFKVKEPDYVSGVNFTRDEASVEDITITYGKVADSSPVRILLDVIADLSERELTIPLSGEFSYSGETSSAGYKIIFDCENDTITKIEAGKYTYNFE